MRSGKTGSAWGAGFHLAGIETRELAVILELVDREIDAAVVGLIRQLPVDQSLDDCDHFRDVVRRLGIKLGVLDAEEPAIGVKDLGDRCGDRGDAGALVAGQLDDFVVDVGEIHHLHDFPSAQRERPSKQILEQKRAEIAEVGGAINRRAAGVDANRLPIGGRERLHLAGQRVV